MTDLSERLAALSPEQRRLLNSRMRQRTAEDATADSAPVALRHSLYFFASARAMRPDAYYRFVCEASALADRAGLHAVWLPERHFVDFGGLTPNPAVLASAVAAGTERIGIRAGSVAAPLHHPVRIAEDWSMVDQISGGRAGLSFASGWHPDDFVLARTPHAERRDTTLRAIDQVRAHWRGTPVSYPTTAGGDVEVRTRPEPVQPELPVWLTAAGSPTTFEAAGRAGVGVMTGLLGGPLEVLSENIRHYRAAWREAGHPGEGDVVVMVHSHVSAREDLEGFLRPAMHGYLRDFRRQTGTTEEDGDVLLESAYLNFLGGSSLLGTPAKARSVLRRLADAGADEVGHLIDFGLPAPDVLAALPELFALSAEEQDR
ncbi:MupA/Atu3671 family FMN-dependent luciferase-like monooxygenase [Streptomyces sp. NPDC001941]|uniref:MupA/Atu3671 family FMN-dependent luciferase-like monooxygenase n=1 Tax=Streptomyces sp. NPDC001941 TaxID=3154659 RepID=UPI0033330EF6